MREISGHDLCKTRACRRCEIRDPDGDDGLCQFCRAFLKRGYRFQPNPYHVGKSARINRGYARDSDFTSPHYTDPLDNPTDL